MKKNKYGQQLNKYGRDMSNDSPIVIWKYMDVVVTVIAILVIVAVALGFIPIPW